MEISFYQVDFQEIIKLPKIDIFIVALGYEARASFLASTLKEKPVKEKYCIQLLEKVNNEEKYKLESLGFKFIRRRELRDIFNGDFEIVLIDYSVMMKSLYAEITSIFIDSKKNINAKVFFSYTHSVFEPASKEPHFVESIRPIHFIDNKLMPNTSNTKLIVSLGYERLSAIGVIEILEIDYSDVIVFINKTGSNEEQYNECLRMNHDFLQLLDPIQIIEINFFNFDQLNSVTTAILHRLKQQNSNVIIAPLSVKTFSLFSMFKSLQFDNVNFYNVTSINNKNSIYQKLPNANLSPIVYAFSKGNF